MHRAVLLACLPCIIAIAVAIVIAWILVKVSGAKLNLSRLRELHSCQRGGVQTLSFVLTVPFFIMISMFIVQVSQLMIGVMTVNYAAFATARSALVWIPAQIGPRDDSREFNFPNRVMGPIETTLDDPSFLISKDAQSLTDSRKSREIFFAAVQGCASICPSNQPRQQTLPEATPLETEWIYAARNAYEIMTDPRRYRPAIPRRIENKIRYAYHNTAVRIAYKNKYSAQGPTYNPIGHPNITHEFHNNEIGWDDPLRITLTHQFALLPGPGRLLAVHLLSPDGTPDEVSPRIDRDAGYYKIPIVATVTLSNQGLNSLRTTRQGVILNYQYEQEDR